jgi:hypothetical protein
MALSIVARVELDMTRQFIPPLYPPYLALVQLEISRMFRDDNYPRDMTTQTGNRIATPWRERYLRRYSR